MNQHMPQLSHSDGLKASLWIDPASRKPAWPVCGHITSFVASPSSESLGSERILTRAETIWQVYIDWIVHGKVDTSVGQYQVWKPEDEYDPLERAKDIYRLDDGASMTGPSAKL